MHEKLVSIGDDYWIENDQGQRVFKVDGEAMRIRDTFQIEDPQGHELAKSAGSSRVWQWRPRTVLGALGQPSRSTVSVSW